MKLEDAIYHTVHEVGVDVMAAHLKVSANTLQHKVNPNANTHYPRPRELVDFQVFAKDYAISHAMASELGGQFVEPCNFEHLGDKALFDQFATLMERVGKYGADSRDALADGRITPREFKRIDDDAYRVMQIAAEIRVRLATMVEDRALPAPVKGRAK